MHSASGEGPAGPEGIAHIADGSFHAPFLIAGAHLAGLGREVVMGGQFDQTGVEENVAATPLQHGRLEIVVKNHAWLAVPGLKGMHMTAQEVLRRLIEKELQIQGARKRQGHDEAGQSAAGPAHHHVAEMSPIHLRLLAGKGFQTQERLADLGAQAGHGAPQLDHAAGVTTVANHVVNAGRAQPRMLIQGLPDECQIRVGQRSPQGLRVETLRFNGVAHCVRMQAQFTGDHADLPMLGVKVAPNLRADFGTDHGLSSPSSWNAWKRIHKAAHPPTDPATHPNTRPGFRPTGEQIAAGSVWSFDWGCWRRPTYG